MKIFATVVIMLCTITTYAQQLQPAGKTFVAMNVPDAAATSAWYEDVFGMKLQKEIKFEKGHIRIIGNDFLVVEIMTFAGSKTLADAGLTSEDNHRLGGYFKFGFYVKDISATRQYLLSKKVIIKHDLFDDEETKTRSFIITDLNNNMIHIIQAVR